MESTERMAELEKKLPKHFLRVDKGCLINTKRLQSADFARRQAMFDGGDFVYMSRRGTKKLFDTLTD
jgi:DNA-binding LytR/AlgR family response regulator